MNLSTVKWAQWDKTHSRELLGLFICVCIALCTIVVYNIAQNRHDNFPSYPPDNHHCSDDFYLRERGRTGEHNTTQWQQYIHTVLHQTSALWKLRTQKIIVTTVKARAYCCGAQFQHSWLINQCTMFKYISHIRSPFPINSPFMAWNQHISQILATTHYQFLFRMPSSTKTQIGPSLLIMASLWNRAGHYIFIVSYVLSCFFLFSLHNLSRHILDVCHTSTHGVALVQI